jgi:hypothetical protein
MSESDGKPPTRKAAGEWKLESMTEPRSNWYGKPWMSEIRERSDERLVLQAVGDSRKA